MAHMHQSTASLRIIGDALKPEEITQLLGCAPTRSYIKGQEWQGKKTDKTYIKDFGLWALKANDCEPENLDEQVNWLLSQLTHDLNIWASIRARYRIDLFCGCFMEETNEGVSISPKTLLALGERGIELGLDIYAPTSEEES